MRIFSHNVNNFGGKDEKPRYDEYKDDFIKLNSFRNNPSRKTIAEKVVKRALMYQPDIIVFHEFDIDSPAGNATIETLKELSYHAVYPNAEISQNYTGSCSSITLIFVKDDNMISCKSPSRARIRRWNEILYVDYIIIGVHVSYDIHFWDEIIDFYNGYKCKKTCIYW